MQNLNNSEEKPNVHHENDNVKQNESDIKKVELFNINGMLIFKQERN